jgi:hypothetical protein
MIHTVKIDDTTAAGKRFMRDFHKVRKGIEFENPAVTGKVPEGYMTGDEFVRSVKEDIINYSKSHGLL